MPGTPQQVLIVEDDEAIATGLSLNLAIEGYAPLQAQDGLVALERIREVKPALVVLDISLPGKNGLEVLRELRAEGNHTPVVVLSARQDEFDKVAALRLGADDYVTKPFALAELLARIAAVLRRSPPAADPAPQTPPPGTATKANRFGDVAVDPETRIVTRAGQPVSLTHLEFELLAFFMRTPAQVLSREQLLREVWETQKGSLRTVDNFVKQLRDKLEEDPEIPRHLVTVRGSGYRFDP
ncbi:MAG: response regulator transcription factor [Deltaproteobacteria bacterium]|nr:response regulator transcription factor [Deltaproteobacteria bacterium]